MNSIQRAELVAYKMQRAKETLAEVDTHIKNEVFHTAVNRLYYACFYAVCALLVRKEISAKKHAGVKQMFGLHFVSTGLVSDELGTYYKYIFEKRQKGDYEDFIYFTDEEVILLVAPAEKLIARIAEILAQIGDE